MFVFSFRSLAVKILFELGQYASHVLRGRVQSIGLGKDTLKLLIVPC